jgi:hypothetical protein
MRTASGRQPKKSACAIILILFLWGSASAGEDRSAHRSVTCRQYDNEVRLQLRIAEAKRNKDSLLYYKSVARQQKMGVFKLPASTCGMPP